MNRSAIAGHQGRSSEIAVELHWRLGLLGDCHGLVPTSLNVFTWRGSSSMLKVYLSVGPGPAYRRTSSAVFRSIVTVEPRSVNFHVAARRLRVGFSPRPGTRRQPVSRCSRPSPAKSCWYAVIFRHGASAPLLQQGTFRQIALTESVNEAMRTSLPCQQTYRQEGSARTFAAVPTPAATAQAAGTTRAIQLRLA